MSNKLGVYIHIPFCVSKCKYCDFLSAPCDAAGRAEYVEGLINEIRESAKDFKDYVVDTIFIGGGTPSILEPEQITKIMETVWDNYAHEKYVECTIECNPGTLTERKVENWLMAGINRISFGLQSANNNELQGLGRIHTVEEFVDSYLIARNCGCNNINVDLMCALPYQTEESFYATLRSVAGLKPEHLSVYSLIVEENTPLYDWINNGNEHTLPSEETERKMYYETRNILKEYGYERYEVSNYSKPLYECRHNLGYWERKNYAGFGLGAASLVGDRRYNNLSDMEEYLKCNGSIKTDIQELSKEDAMEEFMFLGLRKMNGILKSDFEECFSCSYESVYGKITETLMEKGYIYEQDGRIMLTDLGVDVSNVVLAEFLLEDEE